MTDVELARGNPWRDAGFVAVETVAERGCGQEWGESGIVLYTYSELPGSRGVEFLGGGQELPAGTASSVPLYGA